MVDSSDAGASDDGSTVSEVEDLVSSASGRSSVQSHVNRSSEDSDSGDD